MEAAGVEVQLFDRGSPERREQDTPERILQLRILEDALDHNGNPGVVVLLTGDGAGYHEGTGFHSTLERMHKRGWRVEILSWKHSCKQRMRQWAKANGLFIALDDYYDSITFMTPSRPGFEHVLGRHRPPFDLSLRLPYELDQPGGGQGAGQDRSSMSNRVEHLHIAGFRSLADVEIKGLPGVSVLIGANGSGKSNLIRFFEMMS